MKKLSLTFLSAMLMAAYSDSTIAQALPRIDSYESSESQVKWIDPEILRKLQNISPVIRRRIKSGVIEKIAKDISSSVSDVSITTGNSRTVIPELNSFKDSVVIVVSGKTKYPFSISSPGSSRGKTYPPGLATEIVYSESGQVLRSQTDLPAPKIPIQTQ